VLPEAPLERPGGGRAWWEIRLGARPADRGGDAPPGLAAARRDVIALIETLRRRGVLVPEATYLAGFSQGAMLAVDVALEWSDEVAGVAALSGAPVEERRWTERLSRRAPTRVFMSHGRQDPLLAFAAAERLRNRFQGAGSTVEFLPFEGGHTIPRSVVAALAAWLFPEGSQDTIEGEIVGRSPLGHGACVQQSYEVEPEDGPRVWLHFERCGNTSGPPLETLEDGKTYRFTVERGGSSNFADGPMIVAAEELP
ncbi:MAG: dienelactone hydrolase family protein, partial [Myxococcota bacterium]